MERTMPMYEPFTGPLVEVRVLSNASLPLRPGASIGKEAGETFKVKQSLAEYWERLGLVEVIR